MKFQKAKEIYEKYLGLENVDPTLVRCLYNQLLRSFSSVIVKLKISRQKLQKHAGLDQSLVNAQVVMIYGMEAHNRCYSSTHLTPKKFSSQRSQLSLSLCSISAH